MTAETPLMDQYQRIKAEHPKEILLFRMGDFYEMFYDDARVAAHVLGLVLTARNNGAAGRVPLAGVPVKSVDTYIARLVKAGFKVAVCEQMEDPKKAKGIVKRAVTEIITPGTVLSDSLLTRESNNFLASVNLSSGTAGLAWVDLSTGEFFLAAAPADKLADHLRRIGPAELLIEGAGGLPEPPRQGEPHPVLDLLGGNAGSAHLTCLEQWRFNRDTCLRTLCQHFEVSSLRGFGFEDDHPGVIPAGVLLEYISQMQPASLDHLRRIQPYFPETVMVLDESTVTNLELVSNFSGGRSGTLIEILDRTRTPMGARLLRRWVLEPLLSFERIHARHDLVEAFHSDNTLRNSVRKMMGQVGDIQRLVARISSARATPREVVALGRSLDTIPRIKEALAGSDSLALKKAAENLEEFPDLVALVGKALVDDPPAQLADGGAIRQGYSAPLDELRSLVVDGKRWIAEMEATERARTKINNLRIKYNKVFGYFIEVTKSNLDSVPGDYIRKQTISTGERYITAELKEYEEKVLGAQEKIASLEYELFCGVREHLSAFSGPLQEAAHALARLDVLSSLAELAADCLYVRPEMVDGDRISITGGRHPVVERMTGGESFVPNDIELDNSQTQIIILTGPNMAGKSTILRQIGLIVLMAHLGSFVPAGKASICLVDRIFTRVGASDNLARGRSTFMVEMNEAANILNNATPRSLILLDEIGRGTSTFDGLSIAWAITEYLHERPGQAAKTIFATHYHELTELESLLERVVNYNVLVKEYGEQIIFLHKIQRGGSDRSYGIHVARLAGIPREVIERAREVLHNLESGEFSAEHLPKLARGRHGPRAVPQDQLSLFSGPLTHPVLDILKETELDGLSPLEALKLLFELKKRV